MIKKNRYDAVVLGAGIMGCTTALHLAKSGMSTLIIDKGKICREASGVNAGTLTIHMTRAQLIPYAIKGWELWMNTNKCLILHLINIHGDVMGITWISINC